MDNLSMTTSNRGHRSATAYALAITAVAAAAIARWLVQPLVHERMPYATFFVAVVLTAFLGDGLLALLVLVLGAIAAHIFFVTPFGHTEFSTLGDAGRLILYGLSGAVCIALSKSMKHSRDYMETAVSSLREKEARLRDQREWLAVTLASVGDAVIATDRQGRIVLSNTVAGELTGVPIDQALGRPIAEVFRTLNVRTRQPVENTADRVLREGVHVELANRGTLISRDGREHPIEDSGAPIRDGEGQISGAVLVFRDISHRTRAEDALRQSEERFQILADNAPVLIWMAGTDRLCSYVNQPWLQFTGRSLEQELSNGWSEGVHPQDLEECLRTYQTAYDGCKPFRMEFRLRRADGEYRWVLNTGVPRYTPTGTFLGYIGSAIDITERKQAEDTILRQKEAMEDFVSIVAHDLRHPVVSMQGLLSILKEEIEDRLDEEGRENLHMVLSECDRMKDIIGQISYISRIEHEPVRPVPVQLRKMIDDALGAFQELVHQQAVEVRVECPDVEVMIPVAQVEQSLRHLVRNALQYGCRVPPARLDVRCETMPSWVYLTVMDYGPGIAPRFHERIFEVFRRLDPNGPVKGTGVGLAAVDRFMKRIGGGVSLHSNLGEGARFTIFFPYRSDPVEPGIEEAKAVVTAKSTWDTNDQKISGSPELKGQEEGHGASTHPHFAG